MPKKTIKQYEWENRLGTIQYNLFTQGRGIKNFIEMFSDKLEPVHIELLTKLAFSSEKLAEMTKELEDEILK